jgi:hypothetical protein
MGNLEIAAIFIVMVNVLMWFVAIAQASIGYPDLCYHVEGTIIDQNVARGTDYAIANKSIEADLPGSEGSVDQSKGTNVFTDIFNNILGWIKSATGIKYVYAIIAAPFNILNCMGLPPEFIAGIGALWYIVTFLIVLGFLWGRS